jgi:hypothetical protein
VARAAQAVRRFAGPETTRATAERLLVDWVHVGELSAGEHAAVLAAFPGDDDDVLADRREVPSGHHRGDHSGCRPSACLVARARVPR